jgi:hypothetical protein
MPNNPNSLNNPKAMEMSGKRKKSREEELAVVDRSCFYAT